MFPYNFEIPCNHLSRYYKSLRNQSANPAYICAQNMEHIEHLSEFELIGKNYEEIVQYTRFFDDFNHSNRIDLHYDSFIMPPSAYVVIKYDSHILIFKCAPRFIYVHNRDNTVCIHYETIELYEPKENNTNLFYLGNLKTLSYDNIEEIMDYLERIA